MGLFAQLSEDMHHCLHDWGISEGHWVVFHEEQGLYSMGSRPWWTDDPKEASRYRDRQHANRAVLAMTLASVGRQPLTVKKLEN